MSKKDVFSREWFQLWAGRNLCYLIIPFEMEGAAHSGQGVNTSLENIPKPLVLFLAPVWKFLTNDTVLWNALLPPSSSGYRGVAVLCIPPRS